MSLADAELLVNEIAKLWGVAFGFRLLIQAVKQW